MKPIAAFFSFGIAASLLSAACANAAPIFFSGNGHYYEFISANVSFQSASNSARGLSYLGSPGHLATITSASENNFLNTTFNTGQNSQFAWIGGSEPQDNGVWRWVVGPEAGIQFSNFGVPTAPFNYANWGGVEPNDATAQEDYLMFNIGTTFSLVLPGQWADAAPTPSIVDPVVGYLVEYSVVPEPSSFALFAVAAFGLAVRRSKKV